MCRVLNKLIWQGPEYLSGCNYWRVLNSRIPSLPSFCACKRCRRFWIWLYNALWHGSEYAWSTFHGVLNKLPVLNILRLRIWQEKMRWGQGCRKKQSAEYAIILHKVTVQITEQLSRQRRIPNTVKHLRWSILQKE